MKAKTNKRKTTMKLKSSNPLMIGWRKLRLPFRAQRIRKGALERIASKNNETAKKQFIEAARMASSNNPEDVKKAIDYLKLIINSHRIRANKKKLIDRNAELILNECKLHPEIDFPIAMNYLERAAENRTDLSTKQKKSLSVKYADLLTVLKNTQMVEQLKHRLNELQAPYN
ncbi:MAG: hypothetical protein Q7S21_07820 [archaeon]|nr:hypothetical protein [archaeon]